MHRFTATWLLFGMLCLDGCGAKLLDFITQDGGLGGGASEAGGPNCATPACPNFCAPDSRWLPLTSPPAMTVPPPHPSSECPFYQLSWQNFLLATQPNAQGESAFRSYPTIDDLFQPSKPLPTGALAPVGDPRGTALRAWLGNIKQAGGRQILVDGNGHSVYYGIHVNQAFADFVAANGLTTSAAIAQADPSLSFPPGIVELKSAWQDISAASVADYANYITTTAWVSTLIQDPASRLIVEDKDHPRQIPVALLALHVAFALPGHPELIWATFEHVDAEGQSDIAPSMMANPSPSDPNNLMTATPSNRTFPLYKGGTPANQCNLPFSESVLSFDEATQTFFNQQTPIYRVFPASKSTSVDQDGALVSLNKLVRQMFVNARATGTLAPFDQRQSYSLVGAIWMDKPALFALDQDLQNDTTSPLLQGDLRSDISQADDRQNALCCGDPATKATGATGGAVLDIAINGSDSPFSILAGEDRLSSTAIESFTQAADNFDNCLMCHNTKATSPKGVPASNDPLKPVILQPKRINVSHVFSEFLLEDGL
jgi:hypothetical protein